MAKKIELTQDYIALVDDEDYDYLLLHNWRLAYGRNTLYAKRSYGPRDDVTVVLMHWDIIGKPNKGFVVDHINNNGLDNQRSNLRILSHRDNLLRAHRITNAKGITKHYNRYRVRWRGIELGTYPSEIEAQAALESFRNEA